jgi:hypothetical protein
MATKEQVAEFFKLEETGDPMAEDDTYVLLGHEEEFVIQVFDPTTYGGGKIEYGIVSYSREGQGFFAKECGNYDDLETAQRKCLKLAGIDPDAEPSALPGPGI